MYWFEYDAAAEREAIREGAHKAGLKEATIAMIKKLFKENIPIEIIRKVTGQTEEQILAIVNDKA